MNQQTDNQALTRKQMREIRNTASTPIVTGDGPVAEQAAPPADAASKSGTNASTDAAHGQVGAPPVVVPVVPLAKAAKPVPVAPAPGPDAGVDLGVSPLTRRQARQQERIRTASIPVITPDMHAANAPAPEPEPEPEPVDDVDEMLGVAPEPPRPIVNPRFGSELLAGEPAAGAGVAASFDQLIARESAASGATATPNALILSQADSAPFMSPVTATGEVLITGTFALPEGLGSQGHAPGAADGREADAVRVDGELPAHSSPTPIAASAAISTVKTSGEIIRPPAPEKGNRLMLTLAITAGALALALVGVLILAFATGVFR